MSRRNAKHKSRFEPYKALAARWQFVSKLLFLHTQICNRTANMYQNTLFSKHTQLITDYL
jgi:hypothetical protein